MARDNSLMERLEGVEERLEEVQTLLSDPAVISDRARYERLTRSSRASDA